MNLPSVTSQTTIIGLTNDGSNAYNTLSHILFVFDYYIYVLREKQYSLDILITELLKIRN